MAWAARGERKNPPRLTDRASLGTILALTLFARAIILTSFAADLLRSFFISWWFRSALVARNALVGRGGRVLRHSRLPAMFAALVLRPL
jgi:hypothetical protein